MDQIGRTSAAPSAGQPPAEVRPAAQLSGVRVVRIDTPTSPSRTDWREISVLGQPGS